MHEEVVKFGRRFLLTVTGPDPDRRFDATIQDPATGAMLTRTPVRGRSAEEARERALEVLHNLLSIERLQEAIIAAARALAPGAQVELSEDARSIHAELSGPWELAQPFALPRDDVYDPAFDPQAIAERVRAHFDTYLRKRGS